MTVLELELSSLRRGRPLKFTPERIEQIRNLIERGKSRDEIAEIIGVTNGTLQVTCSKLGISLRKLTFDTGTGLLSQRKQPPRYKNDSPNRFGAQQEAMSHCAKGPRPLSDGPRSAGVRDGAPVNDGDSAVFALRMEYRGQERLTCLSLDQEMIGQLAMEAGVRGKGIGELVAAVILEIVKNNLFHLIDHDACPRLKATRGSPPSDVRASA
jgi:hypothetical protein